MLVIDFEVVMQRVCGKVKYQQNMQSTMEIDRTQSTDVEWVLTLTMVDCGSTIIDGPGSYIY